MYYLGRNAAKYAMDIRLVSESISRYILSCRAKNDHNLIKL